MKDSEFAKKLLVFLQETPEWKDNSTVQYLGLGGYTITFSIDICNIKNGVMVCEKKAEYAIADLIDGVRNS